MAITNVIPNGSFETNSGWTFFGSTTTPNYTTDVHYDGNRSLRCTQVTDYYTAQAFMNSFDLIPGKTYRVRFYVQFEQQGNMTIMFNFLRVSGGILAQYTLPAEETYNGLKTFEVTVPYENNDAVEIILMISTVWISGETMKNLWLDALEMCEITPVTYRRMEAVAYAKQFANNYSSGFHSYTNDCANFVSQCLFSGGMPMENPWYYYTPYVSGAPDRGDAWAQTVQLRNYLVSHGYANECGNTQLQKGDLVFTCANNDINDLPHVMLVSRDVGSDGIVYVCGHTQDQNDVPQSTPSSLTSIYYHMADVLNASGLSERFVGYSEAEDFHTAMSDFGTETYNPPGNIEDDHIANVQKRLQYLGYYTGTITSILDSNTESAVEAFKQAKGITPVNGTIGSTTKSRLYQPI